MKLVYASFDVVPDFKGSTTHILANCRAFSKVYDTTLVTLGTQTLPGFSNFRHVSFDIQQVNYLRRAQEWQKRFATLIERLQPDFIQFRTPWEGVVAVQSKAKTVYELNGLPSIELPTLYPNIPSRTFEKLQYDENYCLAHASKILCHSRKTLALANHRSVTVLRRSCLIPNGYHPWDHRHEKLQVAKNEILRLVYLGTLSTWQGVQWSLPVLKRLYPRVHLDIYAPFRKKQHLDLEKLIRKFKLEDCVRACGPLPFYRRQTLADYDFGFAPFRKDKRNVIQGACPVKLLDYMAAKLPILTSNLAIAKPYVEEMQNGRLFHPESRSSLQWVLEEILRQRELWPLWSQKSTSALPDHLTWTDNGKKLRALYKTMETPL